MTTIFPRISARRGQTVKLDIDFYRNGVLTDPYSIRKVEIYKTQVLPHNLVASIPVDDNNYPLPFSKEVVTVGDGSCGTEGSDIEQNGRYSYNFAVPNDFTVPDVYFDLWYYFPDKPCEEGTNPCDLSDSTFDQYLLKCCKRFWIYPDEWFCCDNLQTVNFAFEPLSQKFNSPEIRYLDIGLMPTPIYDYNFNLVNPLIPFLKPTITITTQHCEVLVDNEECSIGLRQGSFRANPWVVKYKLDSSKFYKGTYQYQVKLALPDGTSRVSKKFVLVIS